MATSRLGLIVALLVAALSGRPFPALAADVGDYSDVVVDSVTRLQQLNLVRARCVGQVEFNDVVIQASTEWARRFPGGVRGGFTSKEWQDLVDAERALDRGKVSAVRCQEVTASYEERILRFLKDTGALEQEAERRRIDRIRTTREIDQTLRTMAGALAGVGRNLLDGQLDSADAALGVVDRRFQDFQVALAPLIESGGQQATWDSLREVRDELRKGLGLARQEEWSAWYAAWLEDNLAQARRRQSALDAAGFQSRMTAAGNAIRSQEEFNAAVGQVDHNEARREVARYRPRVERIVADMDRMAGSTR